MTTLEHLQEAKARVREHLDDLSGAFERTAMLVEELGQLLDESLYPAIPLAQDLGKLLRQPTGQNTMELLLRDLADLAEWQGIARAEAEE